MSRRVQLEAKVQRLRDQIQRKEERIGELMAQRATLEEALSDALKDLQEKKE